MKYFENGEISGAVGEKINLKLIHKIANGIILHFRKTKSKRTILVGNDSRISSDFILSQLEIRLLKFGIQVDYLGICSSPCLAYLTKKYNYHLGLMLSDSHKTFAFNGFKFFNSNGAKVGDKFEEYFEKLMDSKTNLKQINFAKRKNVEKLKNDYISHIKDLKRFNFSCIFDCANGGTSFVIKRIFSKHEKININPSGVNINFNCGFNHIDTLKSICIKKQKIGFAFDGDGERIIVITKRGEILDDDKLSFIFSKFFHSEMVISKEFGNIILKQHSSTYDGVLNAIILGNIIQLTNQNLSELLKDYGNKSNDDNLLPNSNFIRKI